MDSPAFPSAPVTLSSLKSDSFIWFMKAFPKTAIGLTNSGSSSSSWMRFFISSMFNDKSLSEESEVGISSRLSTISSSIIESGISSVSFWFSVSISLTLFELSGWVSLSLVSGSISSTGSSSVSGPMALPLTTTTLCPSFPDFPCTDLPKRELAFPPRPPLPDCSSLSLAWSLFCSLLLLIRFANWSRSWDEIPGTWDSCLLNDSRADWVSLFWLGSSSCSSSISCSCSSVFSSRGISSSTISSSSSTSSGISSTGAELGSSSASSRFWLLSSGTCSGTSSVSSFSWSPNSTDLFSWTSSSVSSLGDLKGESSPVISRFSSFPSLSISLEIIFSLSSFRRWHSAIFWKMVSIFSSCTLLFRINAWTLLLLFFSCAFINFAIFNWSFSPCATSPCSLFR